MPQAKSKTSTRAKTRKALAVTALIQRLQSAITRYQEAQAAYAAIPYPANPYIPVPELGREFACGSMAELDYAIDTYIKSNGITGPALTEFRQRMSVYREIMTLMEAVHHEWLEANNMSALEAAADEANEEMEEAWDVFVAHARSHPIHVPLLARQIMEIMPTMRSYCTAGDFLLALANSGKMQERRS
jgi:hypothetical protein